MIKPIETLLRQLNQLDIHLWLEEGHLRYSAPKGKLTAALKEEIARSKDDIIRFLEQVANTKVPAEIPIPPVSHQERLPLSFGQQRLWFLNQLEKGQSATYNVPPMVVQLSGHLNITTLGNVLREICQRHEILRTSFQIQAGHPVQVISPQVTLPLSVISLEDLTPVQQQEEIQHLTRLQAEQPFDLTQVPLLRVQLAKLGPTEHVFFLTIHHIISDGWSLGILVRELSTLYQAYHQNQTSPLAPLPIQYADFAVWQRHRLSGQFLETLTSYWKQQLNGIPALLELPTDYPRRAVQRYRGKAESVCLSPDLTHGLHQLSQQSEVSLFMTLLTAFATLLFRYTGQQDIVIGSPIANRTHTQIESLIGFFLNTLVLRVHFADSPRFSELLQRVKHVCLDAYAHQDLPFEKLVEELHPERNLSHTPLFQVLLVLQNAPLEEIKLANLTLTPLPTENVNAVLDLILSVEETPTGLECKFRYNTDLFEEATIKRLVGHFQTLVEGILTHPEQSIHTLPLLTPAELAQLWAWNQTQIDYPKDQTIVDLFQTQVAKTPENIAVVFEEQQLTYQQLNTKANQLAHYLMTVGVTAETLVGICVERSLEMVIGLLGILKAGGAYVPLDPAHPAERLQFMLADSQVPVWLSQRHLLNRLPNSTAKVVLLDQEWERIARGSKENPANPSGPANLVYVIYTSGSTGKPKGVAVEQAGLLNLLTWYRDELRLSSPDKILLVSALGFDLTQKNLLAPLLVGASIYLPTANGYDSRKMVNLISSAQITCLNGAPSAFYPFLEEDSNHHWSHLSSLRWVVLGGEPIQFHQLNEWLLTTNNQVRLLNSYGPTECTDVSAVYDVPHTFQENIPIGRPIPNTQIYILDAHHQLQPLGIPGELCIAGAGLARGYLNRPELTAERFLEVELFGTRTRVYKTGDLARWLPDGNLEYLGRFDHQVKLRGFRIELGEIEATLTQHEAVKEAVVVLRDQETNPNLAAYITLTTPGADNVTKLLRTWLSSRLPNYMIPASITVLEKLPLNPNGKIDRQVLPSPEGSRAHLETTYEAPQTPLEQQIATLWSDVLGVAKIGRHDNFFELGGDSIKGAIVVNRLQEQLQKIVYVVALFEAPTIAEFIAYLNQHYPEVLADSESAASQGACDALYGALVDTAKWEQFCQLIPPLPLVTPDVPKNPRVILVLSPPRSGSTLMRVILGGHPLLFAPPELELLNFNTLQERKVALSGRDSFWLEGTLRAIMGIQNCDADEAKRLMTEYETQGWTVQQLYRQMQLWLGDRILVDKSPSYALDLNVLKHAELYFENALYIHLLRHPYGMIHSFEEARLHQVFFRYPHAYAARELAELIWLHSHHNILTFLKEIPASRQHIVRFEDLTTQPQPVVEGICQFAGIDFHPQMLKPYEDKKQRMTDGIHAVSKMLGDAKFHTHKNINAESAERWKQTYTKDFLGDPTWKMANQLGYECASSLKADQSGLVIQQLARTDVLPLSFAQQRLWFLYQLEGASATYNMAAAVRLDGVLQEEAMRHSFQAIVQRHENLRACFPTVNGEPRVQIAEEMVITLQVVDLRAFGVEALAGDVLQPPAEASSPVGAGDVLQPPAEASSPVPAEASSPVGVGTSVEQEHEVQRLIAQDAQLPFNLETGPLFRATWLRLGETSHVLVLNMHHIISDGWSMGILIREWSTLYQAFSQGLPASLPPLSIQYVDFAHWQRQWLAGERLAQQVNYWKQQLTGAPALLELPTDHPRPPVQRFEGANVYFTVSSEEMTQLKQFSQKSGATLFMTLLAAFGVLLSRYSGQTDIVIGSPIAGRTLSELESLIGFFVNTLVLRMDLADNPPFSHFLQQVRKRALEAYTHQDIPFEQLVEELQPTRSLSYSPLFQVMFVLQNAPLSTLELPGLTVTPLVQDSVIAKFDLTFSLEETAQGLKGTVEYNTDLFELATMQRLVSHYQTLLTGILSHPDQPVLQLPLLTENEQRQLRVEWNQTQVDYPKHQCVHQLFEAQVEKTPDAIAVVFEEQTLTYRQLNQRANQLAHYLQSLGVQTETLVGICVERSLEMVVGLLGILKAGGAYVPLDPAFPSDRLTFYVEDAKVEILVTQASLMELFSSPSIHRVRLDTDSHLLSQQRLDNPISGVTPANLAYVIYTSGSTGKPKGVMIGHQAVVNFLSSMRDKPGLTSRDVLMAVTTISFDIAGLELYLPLLVGAKIILASRELATDGPQLLEKLVSSGTTVMQATPATWRLLLASGWESQLPLKVLCGGEALTRELSSQLLSQSGEVWNLYGPTETTIWSAVHRVSKSEDLDSSEVAEPLGYPIANTQFYILDAYSQVVPVGVAGELHIGEDGLARGYLNRPELTAEKFIAHPFSDDPLARIYKTGDLARYLPDGNIEYLGRLDNQVKIRGFRIELGEIEAALIQHPTIRESVVIVHTDATGEKRLVAYLVTSPPEQPVDVTVVRELLKQRLPDYMIPAVFISLPALPLTPNGKVNRRALPAPEAMERSLRSHYVAPRDTVELQLVPIWEALLKVHPIGIQDNFFDLGGHSLLAVRMMAQIEQQFQKRLLLASLFQGATIAQQAQRLRQETEVKWSSLVPIQPNGHRPPFFGIAGAGGHVLYFYELARHLEADQPFYGLQPQGLDGESAPHQTVEEMAESYIETMRTVQPRGPYQIGGHSFGGLVAVEMTQQLRKQGEEVALLAILDTPVPPPSKRRSEQDDWDDAQWLVHLSHIMEHLYHTPLSVHYETLRELAPDLQLSYVHEQLKRVQILPPSASLNPFRGIVEVYKANVRTHYYPKVVSPVPITLFKATEVQPEQLTVAEGSNEEAHKYPAFGWRKFGQVEIVEVPGDHLTMLTMPHVAVLAERLMTHLMREVVRN